MRGEYVIKWTLPADTDLNVVEVWEGGVDSAAVVANTATVEYVYRATAGNVAPATPTGGAATDDYVPAERSSTNSGYGVQRHT